MLAVILVSRGVVDTFAGPVTAHTLEGAEQVIERGPAASQIAIKQLGTNGGGFFNANSAHPFESSTPLTNTLELWSELLIAFALPFLFGRMVGRPAPGRRAVRRDGDHLRLGPRHRALRRDAHHARP